MNKYELIALASAMLISNEILSLAVAVYFTAKYFGKFLFATACQWR